MAEIIAIANRKGGVAKTTSCLLLAFFLADSGKRVLMVDNDSQANLTEFFNYDSDELENKKKTIYSAYVEDIPLSSLVVGGNPALVPSSDQLSDVETDLVNNTLINRATILREKLAELSDRYDYILIDCPPWLNVLTVNALAAARSVLIPMATDRFASNGVIRLLQIVRDIRMRLNPSLQVLGILPTRFTPQYVNDRRNLAKAQELATSIRARVFEPIRRSTVFNTEIDETTPSDHVRPDQRAIDLYQPLGELILNGPQ